MWGLQNPQQHRRPDGTDRRNMAEPFPGLLFLALDEQIPPYSLAQHSQGIQLLVIKFSSSAYSGLVDLGNPLGTMALRVHLLAGARNGPTAINGFHPGLHSCQVFGNGQITAHSGVSRRTWPTNPEDLTDRLHGQFVSELGEDYSELVAAAKRARKEKTLEARDAMKAAATTKLLTQPSFLVP